MHYNIFLNQCLDSQCVKVKAINLKKGVNNVVSYVFKLHDIT